MIREERIQTVIIPWLENPYWKSELDTAPTAISRRAVELGFYQSALFGTADVEERKEVIAEIDRLQQQFGMEDWKHMLRFCGHNPLRTLYTRKIRELSEKETEQQAKAE